MPRPGFGTAAPPSDVPGVTLTHLIDEVAHVLPAQGPISIFIHHNTLHAFEHLPFEDAVELAAARFGCQPYLTEERYRAELATGRLHAADVEGLLAGALGLRGAEPIAGAVTRFDLWLAIVLHGIPTASGPALSWLLAETPVLSRFRTDVPADARATLAALTGSDDDRASERMAVRSLWHACVHAAGRSAGVQRADVAAHVRHRDLLLALSGVDTDEWVHPPLIRFISAYLDQGLASWDMPARDRGIHGCFLELYRTSLAALCGPWARDLPHLVAGDRQAGRTGSTSLEHSLAELGVAQGEWRDYLTATLLPLRGWAGMVRQIEMRPDRVPARAVPATLADVLAVRLLLERAAIGHAAGQLASDGSLSSLRAHLRARTREPDEPPVEERAWPLFQVAQLCGLDAAIVDQWTGADVGRIESELLELDGVHRRRILHAAYERALRQRFYDALSGHPPREPPASPQVQAIFCIDEREESFRRHLEEMDPAVETFGTPGFFGVAMYHQGATDAHPRPLCPITITPAHYVPEVEQVPDAFSGRSRRAQRRAAGFLGYNIFLGSRMFVRGAVLMTTVGWLALLPLVLRVIFPWLASHWGRLRQMTMAPVRTRLSLEPSDAPPPVGAQTGFTVPQMAHVVRQVLEDTGIASRLSDLVIVVGHGSISLNNPHESAHDCGACGGGRGGPNARAFAQMANDPRVRQRLADGGLHIEDSAWFVGAERNTCNNAVTFFDTDLVPPSRRSAFENVRETFDGARRREAHERCRRFDAVPAWYPPVAALAHVEGRSADLAQPRPEYGHATNAYCVVGRRRRTAGLFLDRRAFLVSYDPTQDRDGEILSRVMAGVVPVVAGISLEYYFSYVDPTGYGCGTKLPHNVTSLLGVMDGAQSDLRTGLPWQMVEIHEPVRLTMVVEADPARLERALDANPAVARLVRQRWLWLAALDPASGTVWEMGPDGANPHRPRHAVPVVVGGSAAWYHGKHGFLAPVSIVPPPAAGRDTDATP